MQALDRLVARIAREPVFDKAGDRISSFWEASRKQLGLGEGAMDVLHGKWLGHPLHPLLTDVPIGAWLTTAFLDVLDLAGENTATAATWAVGAGVVMAAPTALAGLADWSHTSGEKRRIGVAHALLNTAALGCYTLSLVFRLADGGPAKIFAFAGLGLIGVSAYLGGHLVYSARVGVKHESDAAAPPQSMPAVDLAALVEDTPVAVEVKGLPVMVVRHGRAVYALADTCPHLGCSLAQGSVQDGMIVCGCHGSAFDLVDGSLVQGPSVYSVDSFKTTEIDGKVLIAAESEPADNANAAG
jgi:nitrite reductase/ring-hydroxylating ferredoxin subunit